MRNTVVLGASTNPSRYSYLAVAMLREYGHTVTAIGSSAGELGDVEIRTDHPFISGIHTLTLYLNPSRQTQYYPYILSVRPARLIMNPGTENAELKALALAHGIEVVEACTLVLLRTGQY